MAKFQKAKKFSAFGRPESKKSHPSGENPERNSAA
jgi:hypothetical protein